MTVPQAPLDDLVELARVAKRNAYAPYSSFHVGAALRLRDGRVFQGANVENASYGLSLCAERAAVVAAVLAGARAGDLVAIAVATDVAPPAPPCGMCLQTLAEFSEDLPIVLSSDGGGREETRLADLLPRGFRPRHLRR